MRLDLARALSGVLGGTQPESASGRRAASKVRASELTRALANNPPVSRGGSAEGGAYQMSTL